MQLHLVVLALLTLCGGCICPPKYGTEHYPSPDGRAVALITRKVQHGVCLPGPEPPKVEAKWVRLSVTFDGKQAYSSGFEDVGIYQSSDAHDVRWAPDSRHVAFRAITALRVVAADGSAQSFDVVTGNALISSFQWISNSEMIVVAKAVYDRLDMYGYPRHYHGFLTKASKVQVFRVGLDTGVTERFATGVSWPVFMFRSAWFENQEISPFAKRVAFSDGKALCVYDDDARKVVATAPVDGSIEGTWWETNDRLIVGIALLSGEKRFSVFDLKAGTLEDRTAKYLPLWDGTWRKADWFRSGNR